MRSRLLVSCCALLSLAGCSRKEEEPPPVPLAEVLQHLAARDAKLTSYRIAGTVKDEGQEPVSFTFDYRAPQRMRGSLGAPSSRTFAWDGKRLYQQLDGDKRFTTFTSELPPAKLAGFLGETFGPFTPEGFRAPLLRSDAVPHRSHPRARQATVTVTQTVEDGGGGLKVMYVLRWPTMDFVSRVTVLPDGSQAVVKVEEEHCEQAAGLCVPKRLSRTLKGRQVGETVLTRVELNPQLPNDTFTPTAPEGYEVQTRTLVESSPALPDTPPKDG